MERLEDIDWDNLSNPVPLDSIDPEFPSHPSTTHPSTAGAPESGSPGADPENLEDEFTRLRARMEAEVAAEKQAKREAEKEEASQRERLEQWMANARARLLKADADLTGPAGRIRIRQDHSPSLYRLAEMQKTIFVEGQATVAQTPTGTLFSDPKRKASEPPPDPMATLSVPADQFLKLDAPVPPTPREQPMAFANEPRERSVLHFAIAAVVIVAIGVLGLALFAATQAGLFDGLENRIPFLRPDISAPPPPRRAHAAARTPAATPASVPAGKPVAPHPPARPVPASSRPASASPRVMPRPASSRPVPARTGQRRPIRQAAVAPTPVAALADVPENDPLPAAPGSPAAEPEKPKAPDLAEIILRASVQAATHIDAGNLQEMYNRYALGFPGLSGEVVIGLTVDPGGRILEGSIVKSTTGVQAFDQELLRKVLDWKLGAFPDSRPRFIAVPFLFPLQEH